MNQISVIIIAKNEAENIGDCILSAQLISNNIIVADSGSRDNTREIVLQKAATLLQVDWKGYGQTRNEAAKIAAHDWVLTLDADERITEKLAVYINSLVFTNDKIVYGFKRENFWGSNKIKFGEWGRDKVYRLYNKQQAAWNLALVHENIEGENLEKKLLPGSVLHYTMKNTAAYKQKSILYAQLSADKYLSQGKKASLIKRFISPIFSFIQNYIFRFGFLDGKDGLTIAYISSLYIFKKYKYLHQLTVKK